MKKQSFRQHYKTELRSEAALDFLLAFIIGLSIAALALAYFDVLWV